MDELADLETPSLVVDRRRLESNLSAMAARCRRLGVALRPHVKTHKCLEIARRQLAGGAIGLTVSTLREAELFADGGFGDLTWASPLPVGCLARVAPLAERVRLGVLIDSSAACAELEASRLALRVWIKIDCGYHRAGVDPAGDEVVALAARVADAPALELAGILTHSGHAYSAANGAGVSAVAEEERRVMVDLAERLRGQGLEIREVSVGSTPAMTRAESLAGCTEARPGNYVFFDRMQLLLGSCTATDCALSVLASVVSSQQTEGRAVVDAGALALSKEELRLSQGASFGEIWADSETTTLASDLRLVGLSQEHGKLSGSVPRGSRLRVLPNHACLAVACFDEYVVVDGSTVVDRWPILRER